jgi:hypothetical protein
MADKVFVAIIMPHLCGIQDLDICPFSSIVSAQTWVDKRLADYEHDGIEVNWDILEMAVQL